MNLKKAEQQLIEFTQRIEQCLNLQTDYQNKIQNQKLICNWVKFQSRKIKMELEDQKKKNTGIMGGMRMLGLIKSEKNIQSIQKLNSDLKRLSDNLKHKHIPKNFEFQSKQIPDKILQAVDKLKNTKWIQYYAVAKGPFLKNKYIVKKKHFHDRIEDVNSHNLKLIMIEEKVAHRYQRNLVQQIFGRVIRAHGTFTMVMKIEVGDDPVDEPYFLYCYVEDTKFKTQMQWCPLNKLKIDDNQLYLDYKGKKLETFEQNLLQIIFAEIFVLPVQSLVSSFILKILPDKIQILKSSQQDQELIIQHKALQSHPGLRNPLLFLTNADSQRSATIFKIQNLTHSSGLFQNFYKAMNIIVQMVKDDFSSLTVNDETVNSSLCFNLKTFETIWSSFRKIVGLRGWLKEVISPIKSTISSAEIFNHFCPIFNELSQYKNDSEQNDFEYFQNIEIESFLTTFIKKKTLEKYKNMYVDIDDANLLNPLQTNQQVYDEIFKPILQQIDLLYVRTIQSIYIIDFVGRHKFLYQPKSQCLPNSWKNQKIWKSCLEYAKQNQLKFVDISFDFMAYAFGHDTFQCDQNAFERIKNSPQDQNILIAIQPFVKLIRDKFEEKVLSSLLEKAFKHKKYQICKKLLEYHVRILDFKQTFNFEEIINPKFEILKEKIMNKIKQDSPQMHRIFKWQQLILIELQKQGEKIQTYDFGQCLLPQQIINKHLKSKKIANNLSRKDYKFNSNRQIAQIDINDCKTFYIEKCSYPLLNYFYKIFFDKFGIPEILPYFTTFFYNNRLYTMIEHLPDAINYKKGLSNFSQQQLNVMADQKLMSLAILSTMILLPKQIHLRDILIQPGKNERDQLFILDIQSFYSKNFFMKSGNEIKLNCKNSLFTFDLMQKSVHSQIIKKIADLDIVKFVGNCFEQYSHVIEKINQMKVRNCDPEIPSQQFLGMIFQNGFILNLTQRLFKLKRIFSKKINEKGISFMKILQNLNPQMHDYYHEVNQAQNNALQRQKILFDDNWKKSFVSSVNVVEFFGNFGRPQQQQFEFPDHYYKLCFNGPSESLSNLTTNLKKYNAFQNNLPPDLQMYSNDFFEYFIKNVDNTDLQVTIRQKLMEVIKKKSRKYLQNPQKKLLPLTYIRVQSVQNMKQKYLHSFSYERVQELILQNCKIVDSDLTNMPKSIENILYLQLKGVTGLKNIGDNTLFGDVMQIKHLKVLSIVNCPELIGVDIKCDILQSVQLKDNTVLENLYIYSNFLKNIYCSQNPKMNLQNIGIYILKGINVLMCKTACGGDIMKIYQDTYDKYILNLLKFLLSRFFDLEARYFMILTLSKIKEIDDNLFKMAGIATFKGLSMFSKFTQEVEDRILKSIIDIFFSNPYIKTLPAYLLNQSFIMRLANQGITIDRIFTLMCESLNKDFNASPFTQIQLQRPAKPFPIKVQKKFIQIFNAMKFNRHIRVSVANYTVKSIQVKQENNLNKSSIILSQQQVKKPPSKSISSSAAQTLNNEIGFDESIEDVIKIIGFIGTQKKGINRMKLIVKNSTLSKQFFDKIFYHKELVKSLGQISDQKVTEQQKPKSSQKKVQAINKYKEGLKKIIDNKIMKKTAIKKTESLSNTVFSSSEEDPKDGRIKKLKLQNSVIMQNNQVSGLLQKQLKNIHYHSVKEFKIIKTEIYSPEFLELMPNLTHLHFQNAVIKSKEQKIFDILILKKLKVLELCSFFSKIGLPNKFKHFCQFLRQTQTLNSLIFNQNQIDINNLSLLNDQLGNTSIKQFVFCNNTIYKQQKSQSNFEQQIKHIYQNFLKQTTIKSLTISFSKQAFLEAFILSLASNQSIVQLTLQTSSQISSKILQPLRQNDVLSIIRSTNQLPTWLLTHINSNTNSNYRKSKIFSLVESDQFDIKNNINNDDNVIDMLNNSSSYRNADFYRIGLSLDGGGMRGMLLATQMHYLAKQVGKPIHKIFDCVGGTSIGGILSLAATGSYDGNHPVCNSQQLMQIFTKYGNQIFKKSFNRQFRNLFDTRYSPSSIEGVLKNHFKEARLSDVLTDTSVVVTAVNRMDNKDYIFRSKQALLNSQRDFYMRDVARATSAAPVYFPSAQIKNINATLKLSLLDGGMGMNNPSKLVIDEIKKMSMNSGNHENYFLLSLGTGRLPCENIPESAGLKDISPIIDSFTESANYFTQRDLADHYKGHFIRVSPLINILNKKQGQLDNTNDEILDIYRTTGEESAKKYFKNTVIFGKYRNMNLIQWLQENTARKYDI